MNKVEKEILTKEHIKKDLKNYFFRQLSEMVLTPFLIIFGFYVFKLIFSLTLGINKTITTVILTLYVLFFSLLIIYNIVTVIISLYLTSKNKYEITVDWVTEKLPKLWFPNGTLNAFFFRPYTLVFAKSGKYHIPGYTNYKWSDWFSTQDRYVYERTSLDDEFYLVRIGKKKNIVAYNKKWFELLEK